MRRRGQYFQAIGCQNTMCKVRSRYSQLCHSFLLMCHGAAEQQRCQQSVGGGGGDPARLRVSPTDRPTDRPHLQQRVFLLCGEAASVTVRLGRRQLMWPVDVSDCSLYGQTPSRTGRSFTAVTSPRERLAAARSSRKQAGGRAQEVAPSRLQSKGGKGGETKGGGGSSGIQRRLLIAEPVLWLNTVLKSLQVVFEAVSHVAAAVIREIFSFIPLHCVHSSLNGSSVNSPKLKRLQMKTLKQQSVYQMCHSNAGRDPTAHHS